MKWSPGIHEGKGDATLMNFVIVEMMSKPADYEPYFDYGICKVLIQLLLAIF